MPIINIGTEHISLPQLWIKTLQPQTMNYLGNYVIQESSGYTAIISDVRVASSFIGEGITTPAAIALNQTTTIGTNVSKTVIGNQISLTATTVNTLFGSREIYVHFNNNTEKRVIVL